MRTLKKTFLYLLLAAMVTIVAGCKPAGQPAGGRQSGKGRPLTVTDDGGRRVKLAAKPRRIVSLSPANTEILFALGLGDRVVGVDDFSDYPKAAKAKEKIGGFSNANVEKIVALKPDLVLADGTMQTAVVSELRRLKVTTFWLNSTRLSDAGKAVRKVGSLAGEEKAAAALAGEMEAEITAGTANARGLKDKERPRGFYELYHEPL